MKNKNLIFLISILLINFIVKGVFIGNNSYTGDETFSVYHAQLEIPVIIEELSKGNNPPLYEIILHFWIKLFGIEEVAVRFLSLIFSCVTVFFLFRFCVKYYNINVAIYVSLLYIFSNYNINYARISRAYSMMGMLTIMSVYYFIELLQKYNYQNTERDTKTKKLFTKPLFALIIINTALIYLHYFGFWVLIVEFVFLVLNYKYLQKLWKEFLICVFSIFVLYIPSIKVFIERFLFSYSQGGNAFIQKPDGIEPIYNMIWTFSNQPITAVSVIILLTIFFIKFYYVKKDYTNENRIVTSFICFEFLFIFFSMYLFSYKVTMFMDRYLMPASICFYILLGVASDTLVKKEKFRYILPVIIIGLFVITCNIKLTDKNDMKKVTETINKIANKNSLIIVNPAFNDLYFAYYYKRSIFQSNKTNTIANDLKPYHVLFTNYVNEIDYIQYNHILYVDVQSDSKKFNKKILENHYTLLHEYKFGGYSVYEYKSCYVVYAQ